MKRFCFNLMMIVFLVASVSCSTSLPSLGGGKPANAIEISILYAPESDAYMKDAMTAFNDSYAKGINPVTNQPLGKDEKPVWVTGQSASSGTVEQGIGETLTYADFLREHLRPRVRWLSASRVWPDSTAFGGSLIAAFVLRHVTCCRGKAHHKQQRPPQEPHGGKANDVFWVSAEVLGDGVIQGEVSKSL